MKNRINVMIMPIIIFCVQLLMLTAQGQNKQTSADSTHKAIVPDSIFTFILDSRASARRAANVALKELEKSDLTRLFSMGVTEVDYYKKGEAVTLKDFNNKGYSAMALPGYVIYWPRSKRKANKVTYHLSVDPFYHFVIVRKGDKIIDLVNIIKEQKWHVLNSSIENFSWQTPVPKALLMAKQLEKVVFTISFRNAKYPYPQFAFGVRVNNKIVVVPFAFSETAKSYDISDWFKHYHISKWDDGQDPSPKS